MSESSIICGARVAVTGLGPFKAYLSDGTPVSVERGELGWVTGFKGIRIAIVHFDDEEDGHVAEIPLQYLRATSR